MLGYETIDLDDIPSSESRVLNDGIPIDDISAVEDSYIIENDNVNHPKHYQLHNGLEVIDIIEAGVYGLVGMQAVCLANAIKYIFRFQKKNGIEDLQKSVWYINKLIELMEEEQ